MNNITRSASKIVLLYIVGILGLLALFAGAYSVWTQTFGEAAKIILSAFTGAVTFLLGFYFGYKGEQRNPVLPADASHLGERGEDTPETLPYVGK